MNRQMIEKELLMMNHAGEASRHRLWMHTVAVINSNRVIGPDPFNPGKQADAEEFGTGLVAKWGEHYFILTAKHVLKGAKPSELRIFWFPGGTIESKKRDELRKRDVVDGQPLTDVTSEIHLCGWDDLALITVPANAVGEKAEFVDLMRDWIDPSPGERVHCFGFPSDSGFVWETTVISGKTEKNLAIYPGTFEGEVIAKPCFLTDDFSEDFHYLVPFGRAAEGKHPHGYSGGATWWESNKIPIVWYPNFKFAGICTSWYRIGRVEQVVKASVVRKFIEEVFGEAM